jgi:hypothetical protein
MLSLTNNIQALFSNWEKKMTGGLERGGIKICWNLTWHPQFAIMQNGGYENRRLLRNRPV